MNDSYAYILSVAKVLGDESNSVPLWRSMNFGVAQAYVREVFPFISNVGFENLTPPAVPQLYLKRFWGKVGELTNRPLTERLSHLDCDHDGPNILAGTTRGNVVTEYPADLPSFHLRTLLNEDYVSLQSGKKAMVAVYEAYRLKIFDAESAREFL